MQAGKLRHRLKLQGYTTTTDSYGQDIQNPEPVELGERWGEVRPLSGSESVNARQIQATVTHAITIRGEGVTLTSKDKILFGSRVFQILSILDPEERGIEKTILAVEST